MYPAFAQSAFQTQLAYRSQVWAGLFGELILVFAKIAIWNSIFASRASADGVTLPDMITYAIISGTVVAAWDWERLVHDVGTSIRTGDVAIYLLKPLRYPLFLFASACGGLAFRLLTIVIPTVVIIALVYGIEPPASVLDGALFIVFWVLSFLLLFAMAAIAGLLAFWLLTVFSLQWMLIALLSFLSGAFVPLWFFPAWLAAIVKLSPFPYVGYYPTAIYLGKIGAAELPVVLAIGVFWLLVLGGAVAFLWTRAANRLIVQGG
jgi:ABC-2 type transport system permease protein